MRTKKLAKFIVAAILLCWTTPSVVGAEADYSNEKRKVETLIDAIAKLKDAKFIRNGTSYDVSTAVRFLRLKWAAKQREIKTAHDFIENVASFSGTSGKPYIIRFVDGTEVKSRDYLADRLRKIESSLSHAKTSGG